MSRRVQFYLELSIKLVSLCCLKGLNICDTFYTLHLEEDKNPVIE